MCLLNIIYHAETVLLNPERDDESRPRYAMLCYAMLSFALLINVCNITHFVRQR